MWGRDRLRVLARLLPLADGADVYLLGTGLPSFWVVRMGEMRLILGLSGWTTNDWTSASALEAIAPPAEIKEQTLTDIAAAFRDQPNSLLSSKSKVASTTMPRRSRRDLNRLALLGQVIHDLPAGAYRWRQVMPVPLTNEQIGSENPETRAARDLVKRVSIDRDETTASGVRLVTGIVAGKKVEVMIDGDHHIKRGKCGCSHHFKNALRMGPCRHLQAIRNYLLRDDDTPQDLDRWYKGLWNWCRPMYHPQRVSVRF